MIKQVLVCPETLVLRRLIGIMQGKKCGDGFPVGVKKKKKERKMKPASHCHAFSIRHCGPLRKATLKDATKLSAFQRR